MNKETKIAVEGSIKKWQNIVDGTGVDEQAKNCPLCLMLADGTNCQGTPYIDWGDHQLQHGHINAVMKGCPICLELAKAELEFLRGLL